MTSPNQPPLPARPQGAAPPVSPGGDASSYIDATLLIDRSALNGVAGRGGGQGAQPAAYETTTELQPNPLRAYAQRVWRGKWLILAVMALCLVWAMLKINRSTSRFTATAVMRVEPKPIQISQFAQMQSSMGSFEDLKTTVDVINSVPVMEQVVLSLGLYTPPNVTAEPSEEVSEVTKAPAPTDASAAAPVAKPSMLARLVTWTGESLRNFRKFLLPSPDLPPPTPEDILTRIASNLRRGVRVERGEDNFLVSVSFTHPDPEIAQLVANEICKQYIIYVQDLDLDPYRRLRGTLDTEAGRFAVQLATKEKELADKFVDQPELSQSNVLQLAKDRMLEAERSLLAAQGELAELEDKYQGFTEQKVPLRQLFASDEIQEILDLEKRVSDLQVQLARLRIQYGPENSEVLGAEAELSKLQELMEERGKDAARSLEGQILWHKARIARLSDAHNEAKRELSYFHKELVGVEQLRRDIELDRAFLDDLQKRRREFSVGQSIEPSRAVVHEPAALPRFPIYPNVRKDLTTFGLVGIVLGVGFVLLRGYLDRSVHSAFELEDAIRLPTLGYLPFMRSARQAVTDLYKNPASPSAESFSFLRTSIMYAAPDHRPKTLLVTSCTSREGKTTTSTNLGVTMARLGQRTLIIDCDVKRPSCHRALGVRRKPGLTDYLTGNSPELMGCIVETSVRNLYLLPTGSVSPAAVDLFESEALNRLLTEARNMFDFVIVDSFPLTVGAGTFALATKVDGVAVVIVPGQTSRDILITNIQRLRALKARVIGGIYNFSSASAERANSYGYGYGYGYGFRYGYGDYAPAKPKGKGKGKKEPEDSVDDLERAIEAENIALGIARRDPNATPTPPLPPSS